MHSALFEIMNGSNPITVLVMLYRARYARICTSPPSTKMITIAVGTTNPAKIKSVQIAFNKISKVKLKFKEFQIIGTNVSTTVKSQPMSDEESLRGATERANAALLAVDEADFAIGIESGLHQTAGKWFESGWIVCVCRNSDEVGIASSDRYEIRAKIIDLIQSGLELSTAIEKVLQIEGVAVTSGFSGLITNGIIDRTDSYVNAIVLALGPFCSNPRIWQ